MTELRAIIPARSSIARQQAGWGRWLHLAIALPLLFCFAGCVRHDDHCGCPVADTQAPAAPRDLYSITGDRQVTLTWLANTEPDVRGYSLWWSDRYSGPYHLISQVDPCGDCYWMEYTDTDLTNGQTLYYAVSAFDEAGNESGLSQEEVWDTPRPQGHATIANAGHPDGHATAGFKLSGATVVPADAQDADFYYVYNDASGGYLIAGSEYYGTSETSQIQDLGWTENFDEISFAPDNVGWSPTGTAEPIEGHTYVVLTRDGHYAKIRLTSVDSGHVGFDWAFQVAQWNLQLKANGGS